MFVQFAFESSALNLIYFKLLVILQLAGLWTKLNIRFRFSSQTFCKLFHYYKHFIHYQNGLTYFGKASRVALHAGCWSLYKFQILLLNILKTVSFLSILSSIKTFQLSLKWYSGQWYTEILECFVSQTVSLVYMHFTKGQKFTKKATLRQTLALFLKMCSA